MVGTVDKLVSTADKLNGTADKVPPPLHVQRIK